MATKKPYVLRCTPKNVEPSKIDGPEAFDRSFAEALTFKRYLNRLMRLANIDLPNRGVAFAIRPSIYHRSEGQVYRSLVLVDYAHNTKINTESKHADVIKAIEALIPDEWDEQAKATFAEFEKVIES